MNEFKGELREYIINYDNSELINKLVEFDTSQVYTICVDGKKVKDEKKSYSIYKIKGILKCEYLCDDDMMYKDEKYPNHIIVNKGAPNNDTDGGKSNNIRNTKSSSHTVYYIDVNTGLVYDENYEVIGYYETYPYPQPAPINRLSVPREKGIIKTAGRLVPTKPNKTIVEPKYVRDLESNKSLDVILKDLGKGIGDVVTELYKDPTAEHKIIKPELLPSYVDDVIEGYMTDSTFYDEDDNPVTPEKGKIYLDTETNISYRWTGSEYYPFNEQADWNEEDSNSSAFIKNKPTIPAVQIYQNELDDLINNNKLIILRLYFATDTNKLYFAISSNTLIEISTTPYTPSV